MTLEVGEALWPWMNERQGRGQSPCRRLIGWTWWLPCPPPHSLASYRTWTLDMGSRLSWLIQNPERMNVAIKDQIKKQFSDWFVQMFFFFYYFHIYITRCPLTGPNSKVAPFCVLRTQKSRYCTFTKAPCFCKSRLWQITIRQTNLKEWLWVFPAYRQVSSRPTVQLTHQ